MRLRSATTVFALSAAALLVPVILSAQVTTYIGPPKRAARDTAKPKSPATVAKARADSASRMSLTDMKTWVDSAAGKTTPAVSTADTALATVDTAMLPRTQTPPPHVTRTFSNGAVAPNTATSLPTMLVVGLFMLAAGAVLLRLRPRRP